MLGDARLSIKQLEMKNAELQELLGLQEKKYKVIEQENSMLKLQNLELAEKQDQDQETVEELSSNNQILQVQIENLKKQVEEQKEKRLAMQESMQQLEKLRMTTEQQL